MKPIAVLCAGTPSAYDGMPVVDVFNRRRDARTFTGGMPVIAHPPCRSWSVYCGHQAKPEAGERELALWCVDQVRRWGGVLEQPAHSRLWAAAGLPLPGQRASVDSWSASVWQAWWGYPMRKSTWLYFSGIHPRDVRPPLVLHRQNADRRTEQLMSHRERSATPKAFAEWLVDLARRAQFAEIAQEAAA